MTFSSLFLIGNLGGSEVIIILVVLLLFFGAKKIPELARGLGKGVREFKDATTTATSALTEEMNRDQPPVLSAREVELREQLAREQSLREQMERERAAANQRSA